MTTQAIERCVREGVRIAAIGRSGALRFSIAGRTAGNVLLRVQQLRLADNADRSLQIARNVVSGKVQNQHRAIQRWHSSVVSARERSFLDEQREVVASRLARVPSAPDLNYLRGLEGDATRRYFKAMRNHVHRVAPPMSFGERSRRPPRDPMNALISFVGGLVTTHCVGALESVGLDPQVGFFHTLRPGRPALALDLLEEFRPSFVERLCVRCVARRAIRVDHFRRLAGGAVYLTDEGREAVIAAVEEFKAESVVHPLLRTAVPRSYLPSIQATLLARHLRGDLPEYPPYISES
jgi:CRISPR-associated protein Cas1